MRPIKFRQPLFKSNGEFFKFHYWGDVEGGFQSPVAGNLGRNSQMFTGLLDRPGKEIYEGDIVFNLNDKDKNHEIIWNSLDGCWCLGDEDSYPVSKYSMGEFWEIIGNIYENPECE